MPLDGLLRSAQRVWPATFHADRPMASSNNAPMASASIIALGYFIALVKVSKAGVKLWCGQWQFNFRAAGKFAKWIRLAGPVEAIRAVGVLLQTVFAALVIVSNTNLAGVHFVMLRYGCDQKKLK